MRRFLLLLLAGAAVLTLASRPATGPAVSAQAGYEDQIEDALRRLRASASDTRAWRDLNEGVRAAIDADDIETAATTAATAEELLRQLVTALGATQDSPPPLDPQLASATTEASEAIASALSALRDGARESARASLARAQEASRRGAEQAIVLIAAAQTSGTGGEPLVPQAVQIAGLLAATGGEPRIVDEIFGDVRDLVATQTLLTAFGRGGCGSSGPTIVRQLALGLGVEESQITAAQGGGCRFTGEGSVRSEFRFNSGGDSAVTGTWTLSGPIAISFEVTGNVIQGSGSAQVTHSFQFGSGEFQCTTSGSGTIPLQVTGEATGELLRLRLTPTGTAPATQTCTYPPSAMLPPITLDSPIYLTGTTGTIDLPARDGAQGQLTERPDVGDVSGVFQDWTVTWMLQIRQAR